MEALQPEHSSTCLHMCINALTGAQGQHAYDRTSTNPHPTNLRAYAHACTAHGPGPALMRACWGPLEGVSPWMRASVSLVLPNMEAVATVGCM